MADRKGKRFNTLSEATYAATDKLKLQSPQDEVYRREPNFGGYGTKLNKAKGDPSQYFNEHYNSTTPNPSPKKKKTNYI